uniref:Cytochrome c domain-containing protein n=1 Tax=Eiseniibacteriota bacterium TaxID=2212470 RepID=A0A832MN13_UNCEI
MLRRLVPLAGLVALGAGLAAAPPRLVSRSSATDDFTHFESGHVRPAALTPDGARLVVVNTPGARLAVFDLAGPAPVRVADVPVGLEPVAVACPDAHTAWVVNTLSDDVSIVDLATLHVRATLRVGDEPADVVFAGGLAWVSVSQEDVVRAYDPATLALVATVPVNARFPRALARSADGAFVYVAGFHAGNRTSVLSFQEVQDSLPPPNPPKDPANGPAPRVGLIVQRQGADWRDESGKLWNAKIKYAIHDADVTEISTATRAVTRVFSDLGTVNYALDVAPDGRLALTATEARNLVRFEPNLVGHNVDTRIAFVTAAGAATVRNLNPHVNYAVTPGPQSERDSAIGIPTGVAFSPDGARAYVTSLASDRLAVVDPNAPGNAVLARVPTVAGPTGVVVDGPRARLYVVGRFRGELQTLDAATLGEVARARLGYDPTPDEIVNGRKFFYGGFTSGHGDQACATCHVFGDFDNLAWDLGDPQGAALPPPPGQIDPLLEGFHPMKGPMTTQTLRGLPGTGLLHWRGDRPDLAAFNGAFVSLLGRATALADSEMAAFSDFVLPLVNPPNPNQYLNRALRDAPAGQPSAVRGSNLFFNAPLDGPFRCNDCHTATNFGPGTNGQVVNDAALQEDQDVKVPQLRNLYRKTGMTDVPGATSKRGFGFIHDGSTDNLFNFLRLPVFTFGTGVSADNARRDVEAFLLSFDTGLSPAVGAQVTFHGANNADPAAVARLDTLRGQFDLGFCDLVAKGRVDGAPRGWRYAGGDAWLPDVAAGASLTTAQLRALGAPGAEVTVTGVPRGSGVRMGVDEDRDGHLDGDERAAGSDPANPASTPANVAVGGPAGGAGFAFRALAPNPFRDATEARFALGRAERVDAAVYDVMGREVRSLARGLWLAPGEHALRWDGRDRDGRVVSAGVYFVRVRTGLGGWTGAVVRMR